MAHLPDAETVGGNVHSSEVGFPIHLRHEFLQLGNGHLVVVGLRVAEFDIIESGTCQTSLETEHGLGFGIGIRIAKEREHTRHVLAVFVTDTGGRLVGIEIVLFLAEGKTALALVEDIHTGVHSIRLHVHTPDTVHHRLAEQFAQLAAVGDSGDFIEGVLDRRDALPVAAGGIHSHIVNVAYLLLDSAMSVFPGCDVLDKTVNLLKVVECQFVETAETAVLRCERVVFHPTATRKIIEIVLSNDRSVEVLRMDSRCLLFGACCSHKRDCCKRKNDFFHTVTYIMYSNCSQKYSFSCTYANYFVPLQQFNHMFLCKKQNLQNLYCGVQHAPRVWTNMFRNYSNKHSGGGRYTIIK